MSELLTCPNCRNSEIKPYYGAYEIAIGSYLNDNYQCGNCGETGLREHFLQHYSIEPESNYKLIGEKEIILRFLVAQKISCVVNGKHFLADAIPTHDEQYFHVCCATFTENDVKQIYCVDGNGYVVELK